MPQVININGEKFEKRNGNWYLKVDGERAMNMTTIRLRISCKIISWGVRLMPEDWRTKKAINNLIATNMIQNTVTPK